jgi:hypothetical protein
MTEEQLTALLRLKRFEQPPPEYFERLLQNVHRRQRSELLQRPLWKIAVERVQTFFSEHSMGGFSYATAMASALVVGVGTIVVMTSGGIKVTDNSGAVAAVAAPAQPEVKSSLFDQSGPSLPTAFASQLAQPGRTISAKDPRFVLDARPFTVSYEPEPSTRF